MRRRIGWLVALAALALASGGALVWVLQPTTERADEGDAAMVALGRKVYDEQCASCHGRALEGQPDWQTRMANGRLPAPPHDESGHTWHHPDDQLFGIVKQGLQPYAGPDYESDMPAFVGRLSDREIWAVLAFIKSTWPERIQQLRAERLGRAQQQ